MSEPLRDELERVLGTRPRALRAIAGGDVNRAYRATLDSGQDIFVKTHDAPPAGMYACEARGLAWLAAAHALRIPEVRGVSERVLVLDWIEAAPRVVDFDEQLGRGLARLHAAGAPAFGLATSNFIATLPQDNEASASWPVFYAERRLLPAAARAHAAGVLTSSLRRRIEQLCSRLDQLCGEPEPPSRLHGDLWSGNVMTDEAGAPTLIDPSVYGAERELDLAMLRLFGAPSQRLFAAYQEVYPQKAGVEERVALYQLYPLLVHTCLFGQSYVAPLERALSRYE